MDDGETEAGQGGQKGRSAGARTPPSTARTPRSAAWSRSRRGKAYVRATGFLLNQQRVYTETSNYKQRAAALLNTAPRTFISGGDYCALTRFQYALHHGFGCFSVCMSSAVSSSSIHQDPIQYCAVNWMLEPITQSATWVAKIAWT